ncbi:MAG: 4-alpha-glucanotransferase [Clostridiales bacterium]|nr:4-alpha-glucanotransferase [Clostridiales bacterium]
MERGAGVLMHIASLPGKFGIGTFGKEAYKFSDFVSKSGLKYWQMLPVGHTSYGDSPYQCFSAFAGNPYFIDFDILCEQGLLKESEYKYEDYGKDSEKIDYALIFKVKNKVLKKAYSNFKKSKGLKELREEFKDFKNKNAFWLDDYSLYMAVKNHFKLVSWSNWDEDIKLRKQEAMDYYKEKLADNIEYWNFVQFLFFSQWANLKEYVNSLGIKIIGDIPIYVAEDSVEAWSQPSNFKMDYNTMTPKFVAGCPPDMFSETGQLWGNPIYDWDNMRNQGYSWWISRIRESLKLYDVLRIDHFRGFEAYWEIPYGDETAVNGEWIKGPGIDLFNAIKRELGEVEIIAEDLGFQTDSLVEFLKETGYPGMKVLQFAFGSGDGKNDFLPHNYNTNCIAYTGTHDNDTFLGWFTETGSKEEAAEAKLYLGLNEEEGYNWGFLRGIWNSIANVAIAPMQDFLNLGNDARINFPSTMSGNWQWRAKKNSYNNELANKIYEMTLRAGRFEEEEDEEEEDN